MRSRNVRPRETSGAPPESGRHFDPEARAVGVILNVYVLPPEESEHCPVQDVARALSRAGIVAPPFLAGGALWEEGSAAGRARSPGVASSIHARHPEVHGRFDLLEDALAALDQPAGAMVEVAVDAEHFRVDTAHVDAGRLAWPASLGFYRLPRGYTLRVGADQDFPQAASTFEGRVTEWIWLQGKAAPRLHEFLGSGLHETVLGLWPGARVFDETWL